MSSLQCPTGPAEVFTQKIHFYTTRSINCRFDYIYVVFTVSKLSSQSLHAKISLLHHQMSLLEFLFINIVFAVSKLSRQSLHTKNSFLHNQMSLFIIVVFQCPIGPAKVFTQKFPFYTIRCLHRYYICRLYSVQPVQPKFSFYTTRCLCWYYMYCIHICRLFSVQTIQPAQQPGASPHTRQTSSLVLFLYLEIPRGKVNDKSIESSLT